MKICSIAFLMFIMTSAACTALGDSASGSSRVGDSTVGTYIVPPSWINVPGNVVPVRYTPLGGSNGIVRLNEKAALGMCATLDALCERFYDPCPHNEDQYSSQGQWGIDLPLPPIADVATSPIVGGDWDDETSDPLWATNTVRDLSHSWGRIFPRVSPMLMEVRRRLRDLVRHGGAGDSSTESSLAYFPMSSTLFGGTDIVTFDWCRLSDMETKALKAINEEGLCYDFRCTADCEWRTTRAVKTIGNIVAQYIDSPDYDRYKADKPAPVPGLATLLAQITGATYNTGWLSSSNDAMRITADDFGWMNSLLAIINKSYYGYESLPLVRFRMYDVNVDAKIQSSLSGGSIDLHWNEGIKSVSCNSLLVGSVNTSVRAITNGSSIVDMRGNWRNSAGSISAGVEMNGSAKFLIDAAELGATYGEVAVDFQDVDDLAYGPLIQILIDGVVEHSFYVLNEHPSVPVVSGAKSTSGQIDLTITRTNALPYAAWGQDWNYSHSRKAYRPREDMMQFVSSVAVQGLAHRTIDNGYGEEPEEFAAKWGSRMNEGAMQVVEGFSKECAQKAAELSDGLLTDEATAAFLNRVRLYDDSVGLGTISNGTWSITLDHRSCYLVETNGLWALVDAGTGTPLPQISTNSSLYAYGSIQASASDSAYTTISQLDVDFWAELSAAVIWNWKNLPYGH